MMKRLQEQWAASQLGGLNDPGAQVLSMPGDSGSSTCRSCSFWAAVDACSCAVLTAAWIAEDSWGMTCFLQTAPVSQMRLL